MSEPIAAPANPVADFLGRVEAEGAKILAEVQGGFTYLEHEGQTVLAWVEKEVPGAQTAIAAFLQEAEADAADLAKHAAAGLSDQIAAALDETQTQLANMIQATHLASAQQGTLKAIDVAGIALLKTIGQKAVSVALAQLLAKLAVAAV